MSGDDETVTVTAAELIDLGEWDTFCEVRGWNPWVVDEGRLSGDEPIVLTNLEARMLMGLDVVVKGDA